MKVPEELLYTKDHEWARNRDDGSVMVGITDYAQDALGDITYLELPEVGGQVTRGEACGVIESVKTFSDLYAPVSGTVVEVNEALRQQESLINESPYEEGWMFIVRMSDPSELADLLSAQDYQALVAE
ncbi:MAG: glycine cleavage system protein GcvH [Bradymonadales bacterium]|nr:glycine cleavage system protein GcvH [Bradymonadales bacterium]